MVKEYKVTPLLITEKAEFKEASKEEFRVLLALIEQNGRVESAEALAKLSCVSKSRCVSALGFWCECGVIAESKGTHSDICDSFADSTQSPPSITEEFESRLRANVIDERPSIEVASTIRDENLKSVFDECALLMGVSSFPSADTKNIAALNTQYALSAEFIVTLAAYLAGQGKLTVRRLCNEGIRLVGTGCDTVEELEKYIEAKESESQSDWEFRRILGIYNRNLSKSEKSYFKKWAEDYGFSVAIVSEAFDIAVLNSSRGDLRYMDSILTSWFKAGCKTVSECIAHSESEKAKKTDQKNNEQRAKPRSQAEKPRYGDFDVNDALQKAIARSFSDEDDEDVIL